jgi:hypothetical protein
VKTCIMRSFCKFGQHADDKRRARRWPLPTASCTNSSVRSLSDVNTVVRGSRTTACLNPKRIHSS